MTREVFILRQDEVGRNGYDYGDGCCGRGEEVDQFRSRKT